MEIEMTARQAAIHKAKDVFWMLSRRGTGEGLTRVENGWRFQCESTDGNEWVVILKDNGSLAKAVRS